MHTTNKCVMMNFFHIRYMQKAYLMNGKKSSVFYGKYIFFCVLSFEKQCKANNKMNNKKKNMFCKWKMKVAANEYQSVFVR